jgi:hypothetical protein
MAKKIELQSSYVSKSKKLRKHSKQDSANKASKNYKKPYIRQGK